MLDTEKRRKLIRERVKETAQKAGQPNFYFEVWKDWDSKDEKDEFHCFDLMFPLDNNYMKKINSFIIEETKEKCEELVNKLRPNKPYNLYKYKDCYIATIHPF